MASVGYNELITSGDGKFEINTLRPRQYGRHFADDIFECIFLNENVVISLKISLKFVPKVWINNIPALVQIMAWRRPGDKPLSERMMLCLLTHICITRPQWVNIEPCLFCIRKVSVTCDIPVWWNVMKCKSIVGLGTKHIIVKRIKNIIQWKYKSVRRTFWVL